MIAPISDARLEEALAILDRLGPAGSTEEQSEPNTPAAAALPAGALGPRATLIVTYALCGVANLASVGLLVSTIGTLAPERRAEAAGLGMKSWISGNVASAMTGAWIGLVTW